MAIVTGKRTLLDVRDKIERDQRGEVPLWI